ncbi:MAG: YceI family protein [Firmicutes bacterium]|nr:YceI family protein [Bacillota bacterium]
MQWSVDTSHAVIEFSVRHMGIMTVRGTFSDIDGNVEVEGDRPVSLTARIGVASLNTREERRDAHLRSADFFDVEHHPDLQFRSTAVEERGANRYRVVGDLTIRGQTHPVELEMETTPVVKDPWGGRRMGIVLDGKLNRKQWGLEWNMLLEGGGVLVGEEVRIHVEVEAFAPAQQATSA